MQSYDNAKKFALKKAEKIQQLDFAESLVICVDKAIESEEISEQRGIELFERFEHLCKISHLYFQKNILG